MTDRDGEQPAPRPARKPARMVLKLAIAALIIVIVLIGALAAWFAANSDALRQTGREAFKGGSAFGKGRSGDECVTEALARVDALGAGHDVLGEATVKSFLDGCLLAAKRAEICSPYSGTAEGGAPDVASACARFNRKDDARCHRLIGAVARVCRRKPT